MQHDLPPASALAARGELISDPGLAIRHFRRAVGVDPFPQSARIPLRVTQPVIPCWVNKNIREEIRA